MECGGQIDGRSYDSLLRTARPIKQQGRGAPASKTTIDSERPFCSSVLLGSVCAVGEDERGRAPKQRRASASRIIYFEAVGFDLLFLVSCRNINVERVVPGGKQTCRNVQRVVPGLMSNQALLSPDNFLLAIRDFQ